MARRFYPVYLDIVNEHGIFVALVYGAISSYERMDNGSCIVSQKRIANELGLSLSTVKRAFKTLKTAGKITVERDSSRATNKVNILPTGV